MSYIPSLYFGQTSSVTVANTTTETTLIGAGKGSKTIAANAPQIGDTYLISGLGIHSAVSNPNITINITLGATTICTTGVVNSANSTNALFEIRVRLTFRTLGVSGTLFCQGYFREEGGGLNNFPMVNTSTTTIDTTSSQTFDVTVTWGTASSSNTITMTNLTIQLLNS